MSLSRTPKGNFYFRQIKVGMREVQSSLAEANITEDEFVSEP